MPKVRQERDICIGCGACASLCPDYWEMSEDGKANLKGATVNSDNGNPELELDNVGCNQEAADACPVQCILILKE